MRRLAVLASLLAVAAALLARRRRARRPPLPAGRAEAARRVTASPAEAPAGARPGASPEPAVASEPQASAAPAEPDSISAFVSVPWTLVAAPPDRPALTVRYGADRHAELDRVDVQETPTQVFVTVLVRRRPAGGGGPAGGERHEATAALSAPLGERELVHAAVDPDGGGPGGAPL